MPHFLCSTNKNFTVICIHVQCLKKTKGQDMLQWHVNNNNNNNNNNGNFVCVFERTIVNLATYRQFTNAAWDWIVKKKKKKKKKRQNKTKQKPKKKKSKLH